MALVVGRERPICWVAKESLKLALLFKYTVPINLENPRAGAIKKIYRLLKEGEILGIFPEGSRFPQEKRLFSGAVRIAEKTAKPIIPLNIAVVKGNYGQPNGKIADYLLRRVQIEIRVGRPLKMMDLEKRAEKKRITTEGKERYRVLMAELMEEMDRL
jgi:1-acyl-sn-glycerol-3-phosphate acyltransferase